MARILIVDDEERIGLLLSETLTDMGHRTVYLTDGGSALERIERESFDLVITDLRMEPVDGMQIVRAAAKLEGTDVAVLTAHGSTQSAVTAMKAGAIDYLQKPLDLEEMSLWVTRWEKNRRLGERVELLTEDLGALTDDELIGTSPPMDVLRSLISRVARTDTTVLITGESGTGKELVARAVHRASPRAAGPFVATNCAALTETLLESELFGHERGAFTGAVKQRAGRFEMADGGTLFLDEIGEISAGFQAKLLRAIERREIVRVGAAETIAVDVRVIVATNRNLEEQIALGKFREDLYFRLNVFPIQVPPLRDRPDDIEMLSDHFLRGFRYPHPRLRREVLERLTAYHWPGNVRELRNVLERATILAAGDPITTEYLGPMPGRRLLPAQLVGAAPCPPATGGAAGAPAAVPDEGLGSVERRLIEEALRVSGGNKSEAARRLKITRRVLYAKLRRYGLDQS